MPFVKKVIVFLIRHAEIAFISFLLFFKMYSFAKEVGIVFIKQNLLMVSIGSIIILFSFAFLFDRTNRLLYLILISSLGSLIVYADLVYFRYFGDFVTTSVIRQSNQMGAISSSIMELMKFSDIIYFLDTLLMLILFIILKIKKVTQKISVLEKISLTILGLVAGTVLVFYPINNYIEKYGTNLFLNTWSNVSIYNQTGHLGFHVFETKKYIKEHIINKPFIKEDRKQEIFEWLSKKNENSSENEFTNKAKDMNLIIVQLESFQNYVINKKVNGQEITPNLNKLIEETMYFNNFYHQVGQGRTSDAEFLVNNSLYPLPTGSVYVRYPTNIYDSLPKILKEKNYNTFVFHSYEKNFWNRRLMYDNYQFDEFIGKNDLPEGEIVGPFSTLGDEGVFLEMIQHSKEKQPFYSFIVALSSHHPYTHVPAKYKTLNTDIFDGTIFADYLHSVHYVDLAVGKMVEKLKEEGLWENTVVILYGDHDSGIPLTNEIAKGIGINGSEIGLKNVDYGVPLFIHVPGNEKLGTFENSAGMIDITPTVLNLLGMINQNYVHLGQDILNFKDHLVPFRYGSYKQGDIYYQASLDGDVNNGKCYNVAELKEQDLSVCKESAELVKKTLQNSDQIIYHNLIKEFD